MTFDPAAPLPDAPDPWAGSEMPAWRDGPPWAMTEMISAEPALAGRLVDRLQADPALARVAAAIRESAVAGEPITTTGCGTSQHAAMAVAALLADGLAPHAPASSVQAVQAFELSGSRRLGGFTLAVSHEGGTEATNRAVAHAGGREAATALITVSERSPGAALARDVIATREQDQSWCHTVGYLSPLVAGACLRAALRAAPLDADAVADQVAAGTDAGVAEHGARALTDADRLLIVGSGADWAAARELALKVEEGVHLPTTAHELETIRHGHWAATTQRTGLVLVLADGEDRGAELTERAVAVLRAAEALGLPTVVIAAADRAAIAGAAAGVTTVPFALDPRLDRLDAAILGVVTPLQLLTERLARARGVNPDTIGRDDPRHAAAAADFGPWQA
ncbi:MAG TPA: SIS domain-containing protein [Candidatus Limnocylindria bacterium]|jgi:fructoselysine-6-P-deglycase FrlB-like protein